tara:strand:- start:1059 stop:1721 length:663 start_codon:yes stop_codon:yes gene_type:complete
MSILRKINLGSFSKYKLWIIILILVIIQTSLGQDMNKKIEAREPDFVYNNSKEFIKSLNECINWQERNTTIWQNVPREIIVAQAVIESAYGTSRFAKQGNNLFGVMTFNLDEPHLKPSNNKSSKFGAKIYQNKCESVKDYIIVLNTGSAFTHFRELRFQMLKNNDLDVLVLVETLTRYATNPNYIKLLKKTIKSLRKENEELAESYKESRKQQKERYGKG